jgi:5-methylcytosine-specific restriction endonuclease McrA
MLITLKYGKNFKHSKLAAYQKTNQGRVGMCPKCGRESELTVDHLVPVSFLDCLDDGYEIAINDEENFEALCRPCNMFKSSRIDITNPKTARLITKYMQPYL